MAVLGATTTQEQELLARLQAQFGDMDVGGMLDGTNKLCDNNGVEDDAGSESSMEEPTAEELLAWQEAQFTKGQTKMEAKKIMEGGSTGNIHKSALQRRRQNKTAQERTLMREYESTEEADEWEHVVSEPDLGGVPSIFFPTESDGLEIAGGVHPLLLELGLADSDVLCTKWARLYSSSEGDGLSFRALCDKITGYDGPTMLLIGGVPSASKCLGEMEGNTRVSLGFFTTDTWKSEADYHGSGDDCFLFSLDYESNNVKVVRPKGRDSQSSSIQGSKRYMYCHPSSLANTNRRRKDAPSQTNGSLHGIGIGGFPSQPRVHITENLELARALAYDKLFEDGDLLLGNCDQSLYHFDIDCIEVWGVGGEEWIKSAMETQAGTKELHASVLEHVRKVDKAAFMDDFKTGLTTVGTDPGLFAHQNHVEERCDF